MADSFKTITIVLTGIIVSATIVLLYISIFLAQNHSIIPSLQEDLQAWFQDAAEDEHQAVLELRGISCLWHLAY